MHPHYCGNMAHDVPMFFLWLMSFAPDWVPMIAHARGRMLARVRAAH